MIILGSSTKLATISIVTLIQIVAFEKLKQKKIFIIMCGRFETSQRQNLLKITKWDEDLRKQNDWNLRILLFTVTVITNAISDETTWLVLKLYVISDHQAWSLVGIELATRFKLLVFNQGERNFFYLYNCAHNFLIIIVG